MEEHFQTFDTTGKPTGLVPRTRVHREGLWHRAVYVFLFRTDGALLLQRRDAGKDVCPGAWDLSVAEHLQPGETYHQAAVRGLQEELGVTGVGLKAVGAVVAYQLEDQAAGIRDYEFQQCFMATCDQPIQPDPAEVSDIRWIDPAALTVEFQAQPDTYTPWFCQRALDLLEEHVRIDDRT